ncbi:MAG: stage II sporulation protein SpoIID, partial [Clostridiales bacterium]|nr:stage II sporulation protein SpoIID [Clostridiales bacterium]
LYTIKTDADVYVAAQAGSSSAKTQLGGLTVQGAGTAKTVASSSNKITILGADGKTKTAALIPETYTFTGEGWGHAVGLSQEGACSMAVAGIKFDEILKHYFPGTNIE